MVVVRVAMIEEDRVVEEAIRLTTRLRILTSLEEENKR